MKKSNGRRRRWSERKVVLRMTGRVRCDPVMGSCWCKEKSPIEAVAIGQDDNEFEELSAADREMYASMRAREHDDICTDQYVREMIQLVGSAAQSFEPAPLVKLHCLADGEEGWQRVIASLVHCVPLHEPLGPSAMTIIFDDCPLPPAHIILATLNSYGLCTRKAQLAYTSNLHRRFGRNLLIVLGCMADRFIGPTSTNLMTMEVLDYVFYFLRDDRNPELCLHGMIVLEKLAKTKENQNTIKAMLLSMEDNHPLVALEAYYGSPDYMWRQAGFCARWLLDNIFVVEDRPLSHTTHDMSETNAILDSSDTTNFLKISSDGLEARSDSHTFESVRCTFSVDQGCWYYEVEIITPGVMQIGFATKETKFKTHEGFGIGDDHYSVAYDGCRRLLWHRARPRFCGGHKLWGPGDILGCLIDIANRQVIFSLNGVRLPICSDIFKHTRGGFYAAASFMCFQQARFNFGKDEFRFAPTDRQFMLFNEVGKLTDEQKQVIPRWLYLRSVREQQAARDLQPAEEGVLCAVCYDNRPNCIFSPCRHMGFCRDCAYKMSACPLCREQVWHYTVLPL